VAEDLLHERRRNERTTTNATTNSSLEIIIGSNLALIQWSRDCSIGKIRRSDFGQPRNCGSIPGRSRKFIPFPNRPNQLQAPLSPPLNGYQGVFSHRYSGRR